MSPLFYFKLKKSAAWGGLELSRSPFFNHGQVDSLTQFGSALATKRVFNMDDGSVAFRAFWRAIAIYCGQ